MDGSGVLGSTAFCGGRCRQNGMVSDNVPRVAIAWCGHQCGTDQIVPQSYDASRKGTACDQSVTIITGQLAGPFYADRVGSFHSWPPFINGRAVELISSIWQILATLAIGGIVLVLVLAIIEPGPLVKKRPFARKRRSQQSESEDERIVDSGLRPVNEVRGFSADQRDDEHNPT